MALVPTPPSAKPISDSTGQGEKNTISVPTRRMPSSTRDTPSGECFSTTASAKKRVVAWLKAKQATAMPLMNGPGSKMLRM